MLSSRLIERYTATYSGFSKAVWLITMAVFFDAISQMMAVFFSLYLKNLGFSVQTIGIAITLFGAGYLVGGYISGYLCDKMHPKNLVYYCMLFNSLFILSFIFSENLYFIYTMLVLCGISGSGTRPASVLLICYSVHQKSRSRALGLRRVGINFGMGLASVIGGMLAMISFHLIFLVASIATLIATIFLMLSPSFNQIEKQPSDAEAFQSKRNPNTVIKKFLVIISVYLMTVLIFTQMRTTYPLYLVQHFQYGTDLFSAVFALNCFLIVLFEVPLLTMLDGVKPYVVAAFGALLIGLGFGMLPLSNHVAYLFLSTIIWSFGEILFFPTLMNVMLRTVKFNQGKYIGIYQSFYAAGTLISPLLGTSLYKIDQGHLLWGLCAVLGVFLFVQVLTGLKTPESD